MENQSENMYHGWEEYLKYSNVNMTLLSSNPNITLEHVISNQKLEWNYYVMSHNENIHINDIIETFNKYQWGIDGICKRIHFFDLQRLEEIIRVKRLECPVIFGEYGIWGDLEQPDDLKIDYYSLSSNSSIPFSYVLKNKTKEWHWPHVIDHILSEYDFLNHLQEVTEILKKYSYYPPIYRCNKLSFEFLYELSKQYEGLRYTLFNRASLKFILQNMNISKILNDDWYAISYYK